MNTYYKYTNHFDADDFTLRLSIPKTLNDPFENIFFENTGKVLHHNYGDDAFGLNSTCLTKAITALIGSDNLINKIITNELNAYGIISLTETPDNILMWSHYANEHKGLCIGLKSNFLYSNTIDDIKPIKVNYSHLRPKLIDKATDFNHVIGHLLRDQLTTKSKCWEYEKEHRCIIPITSTDSIKISSDPVNAGFIKYILEDEFHFKFEKTKGRFTGNTQAKLIARLDDNSKDILCLKHIPVSKIESIYFGCNYDKDEKEFLIHRLSQKDTCHIKIYECSVNKRKFELDIDKINT